VAFLTLSNIIPLLHLGMKPHHLAPPAGTSTGAIRNAGAASKKNQRSFMFTFGRSQLGGAGHRPDRLEGSFDEKQQH
jgi:hypothetical protein